MTDTIDLADTSTANQPAIAEFCAEFVLGWKSPGHLDTCRVYARIRMKNSRGMWLNPEGKITADMDVPNPFTSADDDLPVLVHVRENWNERQLMFFSNRIEAIWWARCEKTNQNTRPWRVYEPGDYCVAACRVIQEQDND